MPAHKVRRNPAKGHRSVTKGGRVSEPRIMATLPEEDFQILSWWAAKHKRPLTEEVRRAVYAYVHCLRPDFPGNTEGETA